MPERIRVGIVGCGEVAQIIHLPSLVHLRDRFRVTALCDVSAAVLGAVGEQWNVTRRYADFSDLVRYPEVDAVLIANPHVYHAEVALAAMAVGKHVMIEKPMCITLREADDLIAAQARSGVVAQVGYMRRHAAAFAEAKTIIAGLDGIRLARVYDVIGRNALIIDSTSNVVRGTDIAADLARRVKAIEQECVASAIGPSSPDLANAYLLLLGLGSHDISAMRELLGLPRRVLFAAHRWEGRFVAAAFDYGGFICQFSTGVDQIPHFDAFIEVSGGTRSVRLDYDTPYVRNLATRLTVLTASRPAGMTTSTGFPTRTDAFLLEWQDFHANVIAGSTPRTSLADSREDLVLFAEMATLMRQERGDGGS